MQAPGPTSPLDQTTRRFVPRSDVFGPTCSLDVRISPERLELARDMATTPSNHASSPPSPPISKGRAWVNPLHAFMHPCIRASMQTRARGRVGKGQPLTNGSFGWSDNGGKSGSWHAFIRSSVVREVSQSLRPSHQARGTRDCHRKSHMWSTDRANQSMTFNHPSLSASSDAFVARGGRRTAPALVAVDRLTRGPPPRSRCQ
jgi:hypothetical protein